jgi:hypothetical protein
MVTGGYGGRLWAITGQFDLSQRKDIHFPNLEYVLFVRLLRLESHFRKGRSWEARNG